MEEISICQELLHASFSSMFNSKEVILDPHSKAPYSRFKINSNIHLYTMQ